ELSDDSHDIGRPSVAPSAFAPSVQALEVPSVLIPVAPIDSQYVARTRASPGHPGCGHAVSRYAPRPCTDGARHAALPGVDHQRGRTAILRPGSAAALRVQPSRVAPRVQGGGPARSHAGHG